MSRIMAVDYGLKRAGIAVTDDMQIIATPLTSVDEPVLLPFLKEYIKRENVECIVVGKPVNLSGKETDASSATKKFIEKLKKNIPEIKVETYDERFTSVMAAKSLIDSGVKKMKRRNKKLVDEVSAVILLQSYLESKNFQVKRNK